MARVLKAKYFKNSSFMDANLGANPSFVWRIFFGAGKLFAKAQNGGSTTESKCMFIRVTRFQGLKI